MTDLITQLRAACAFDNQLYVSEGKNYQRSAKFENVRLQPILEKLFKVAVEAERMQKIIDLLYNKSQTNRSYIAGHYGTVHASALDELKRSVCE